MKSLHIIIINIITDQTYTAVHTPLSAIARFLLLVSNSLSRDVTLAPTPAIFRSFVNHRKKSYKA